MEKRKYVVEANYTEYFNVTVEASSSEEALEQVLKTLEEDSLDYLGKRRTTDREYNTEAVKLLTDPLKGRKRDL